jgi:transient receptor potential cation channel subfamily C protein 2
MFWVLFGFTDDTFFETGSDVENSAEIVVGTTLFALWCVVAIIILLNLLIALISNSFQKIQDNADIEWKYARAWIIRDIIEAPLVPIPVNLIHPLAKLLSRRWCTNVSKYLRIRLKNIVFTMRW